MQIFSSSPEIRHPACVLSPSTVIGGLNAIECRFTLFTAKVRLKWIVFQSFVPLRFEVGLLETIILIDMNRDSLLD